MWCDWCCFFVGFGKHIFLLSENFCWSWFNDSCNSRASFVMIWIGIVLYCIISALKLLHFVFFSFFLCAAICFFLPIVLVSKRAKIKSQRKIFLEIGRNFFLMGQQNFFLFYRKKDVKSTIVSSILGIF